MKRFLSTAATLLLIALMALPPSLSAMVPAVVQQSPCTMHTMAPAGNDAQPPCEQCDAVASACSASGCACCHPAAVLPLRSFPFSLNARNAPLVGEARYRSVTLSLDLPPPRSVLRS
jgi:hypothetical protein